MGENHRMARSKELYDWKPEFLELIDGLAFFPKYDRRFVSVLAIWIMVSLTGCRLYVEGRIRFVLYLQQKALCQVIRWRYSSWIRGGRARWDGSFD
jgi:hypothetical protein